MQHGNNRAGMLSLGAMSRGARPQVAVPGQGVALMMMLLTCSTPPRLPLQQRTFPSVLLSTLMRLSHQAVSFTVWRL